MKYALLITIVLAASLQLALADISKSELQGLLQLLQKKSQLEKRTSYPDRPCTADADCADLPNHPYCLSVGDDQYCANWGKKRTVSEERYLQLREMEKRVETDKECTTKSDCDKDGYITYCLHKTNGTPSRCVELPKSKRAEEENVLKRLLQLLEK